MPLYTKCSRCSKRIAKGSKCECVKELYKEYNKKVRYKIDNIQYTKFYNSTEWKRLSQKIRIRYNGLCLMCLIKFNEIVPIDVVHHIEEIRECWDKRLDEYNLIPLCHRCHNFIHSYYDEVVKAELRELLERYEKIYI